MKGTRAAPECGFSARVVDLLDELLEAYTTVNVLASAELREGIKSFSRWPTLPQLYVEGKLIGGTDIVEHLHRDGELAKLLGTKRREVKAPGITITGRAVLAVVRRVELHEARSHVGVVTVTAELFRTPRSAAGR